MEPGTAKLSTEPGIDGGVGASMEMLQARGVTKLFGGLAAVSDVSFDLRQGEILGLIGPNGSGKTTLVNVITGTLDYSGGDVLFQGRSIRELPPHEIANTRA